MAKKRIFISLQSLLAVASAATYLCNKKISDSAKGKLFADTKAIPFNKVGLLLGTSKYLPSGAVNSYYTYRIDATFILVKDARIK